MGWKIVIGSFFFILVISMLIVYWFFPFGRVEFNVVSNSNFSIEGTKGMQFYDNMRFPSNRISYRIDDCTLQKRNDMENAFEIISRLTVLGFYPTASNEEISVYCESTDRIQGGMFILGEGGPINITKAGNFNVILNGRILLRKESQCPNPNVAIHELLHVLGFEHSTNPNNIMYNFSKCEQTIGDDIPELINKLYAYPSYVDLVIENASAVMNGRYLNANITVKNNGLRDSEAARILIYADNELVNELSLNSLGIGYGNIISLKNIRTNQIEVSELRFKVEYDFQEINKDNNELLLKIKK